jgi:hypothetical protein
MQSKIDILAKLQAKPIKRCFRTYICIVASGGCEKLKDKCDPFSRSSFHATFPSLYLYQPLAISILSAAFSVIFGGLWAHHVLLIGRRIGLLKHLAISIRIEVSGRLY